MPDVRLPTPDPTIAEALSALPLETPDRSAWPLLAERIAAKHPPAPRAARGHRWLFAAALAAAVGAVALLPRDLATPPVAGPGTGVAATPAPAEAAPATVESLMAESARLEYLLQQVGDASTGSASATSLALEYEARVQALDVALSAPTLTPAQRADLWSRRVELLREYAALEGTQQWLATQGQTYDGDLVAVY